MKTKTSLLLCFILSALSAQSQRPTMELTFTAIDSAAWVQLDSIKVMNRTQGGDVVIYWPDTSLSLEINQGVVLLYVGYATLSTVGVQEASNKVSSFEVFQNHPNPLEAQSVISMYIPQKGKVNVMITDLQGKLVLHSEWQLDGGYHSFRFLPGNGNLYFLTAHWNGTNRSIKMISTWQNEGYSCRLEYVGSNNAEPVFKASLLVNDFIDRQSGILDSPEESQTYTFQFATNIPCLGTPTVEYEGQIYNTIQIFSQCWLKENLNVGEMITGTMEQSDNGTIEKYCYNNDTNKCNTYGGLYQWREMMQYTIQQGTQGICPLGWHLPTDEEWKVLEGAVDSEHGIGDNIWDGVDFRGYDAGTNLKTSSGWYGEGNGTDLFGFSGLPGGYRRDDGGFYSIGLYGNWWTSSEDENYDAWNRCLSRYEPEVFRDYYFEAGGFSVRCLKDY